MVKDTAGLFPFTKTANLYQSSNQRGKIKDHLKGFLIQLGAYHYWLTPHQEQQQQKNVKQNLFTVAFSVSLLSSHFFLSFQA